MPLHKDASSFRDPAGFVFFRKGILYRQINQIGREDYDLLLKNGLYEELTRRKLLISHREVDPAERYSEECYKILHPEPIPFISYPYEWCFSQLKDAALLTLEIQKTALRFGMSLKDASAYNIQFLKGRPVLIDTLSFERYEEGKLWVAYRQFCQHFLAPLALISSRHPRLIRLLHSNLDGLPLSLAASLVSFRDRFNLRLGLHLYLHGKTEGWLSKVSSKETSLIKVGKSGILGLVNSLEATVRSLSLKIKKTEWSDYENEEIYSKEGFQLKEKVVAQFLDEVRPATVWDLGSNTGRLSRMASQKGGFVVSVDEDPICVEKNYLACLEKSETNLLPLCIDLTNPSPPTGWAHQERMSLIERGPADTVLALALIHHWFISGNLPFEKIASFLSEISRFLIVEFVPPEDPMIKKITSGALFFPMGYTQKTFEQEFSKGFSIKKSVPLKENGRTLYLMEHKGE